MPPNQPTNPPAAGQAGQNASSRNSAVAKNGNGADGDLSKDPIALIKSDHRHVEQLFGEFEKSTNAGEKSHLAEQICHELMVHALLEEEIFYPACRDHMEPGLLDEAQVEHDSAKQLIREVMSGSPNEEYFEAKVKVLAETVKHHIREEEKAGGGILAKAKAAGVATAEMAQRLMARKQELMSQAQSGTLGPPETRSFRTQPRSGGKATTSEEYQMARGHTAMMERDERGRFMSDDDDRDYRRSRNDDDYRRRTPPRDDEGRFMSRDEYDDRGRSRSRYDDDDDDRRGGRRHGGWYGDSRGHSEATREGWEERGYRSRGGSRYDDDDEYENRRRGSMRGGEIRHERAMHASHDRGRAEDRGQGGWFGDPEGHSEAAREGWDNPRHRPSGWFGDPEGHSEVSRRGWDNPRHRPSGWFGDPEGHSEASRRGWDNPRHGPSGWYGDPEGHSEASREGWEHRGGRSRYDDDDDDYRGRRGRR